MQRFWVAVILLLAPLTAQARDISTTIVQGDFRIRVELSARTNLIYQLDCVTDGIKCTSDVFKALWTERFLSNEQDRALVREWAELRASLNKTYSSVERKAQVNSVVPMPDLAYVRPWSKLRISEFDATDEHTLKTVWRGLLKKQGEARLAFIYHHFKFRFRRWWLDQQGSASEFVPGIEAALRRARAAELLMSAATFYGATGIDREVSVHLVLQPKSEMPSSRGECLTRHMVIEVVRGERPEDRVPVIVHELAHYVFGQMPQQQMADFAGSMIAAGSSGMPAWNLFNEVQATVIGNVMAARNLQSEKDFQAMLARPQSLYADHFIDEGAKASMALFDEAYGRGRAMPADFPARFAAALKTRLGTEIETPALVLRSMAVNHQDGNDGYVPTLMEIIKPWSVWGFDPLGDPEFASKLNAFKGLSAVIIARLEDLPKLASLKDAIGVDAQDLQDTVNGSRGLIFVARRTPMAFTYALVGRDDRTLRSLIAILPHCSLKPGVCARLEN